MSDQVNGPKVTVLMSVYNGDTFLKEAVESIIEQTFGDFEFLVIDDGSSDSSVEIIRSYGDRRIRLISNEKNIGLAASLNSGIRMASGEYIVRMDSDDISLPDRLQRQVDFMETHREIAVCGSYMETIGEQIQVVKKPINSKLIKCFLLAGSPFSHPTVLLRTSLIQRYDLYYNEDYSAAQDYDLWARILQIAPGWNIDEVLLHYRLHNRQLSIMRLCDQDYYADQVRKKTLSRMGINPSEQELTMHAMLFKNTLPLSEDNARWARSWVHELVEKNTISMVFDKETLDGFLTEYLGYYFDRFTTGAGKSNIVNRLKRMLNYY